MSLLALLLLSTAPEILAAFEKLAAQPLWPGFTPAATPLALSDGAHATFYKHPHPPADFAVRANTSEEINGVDTATLLIDPALPAAKQAAVLIHETFHVYQGKAHPGWSANEAELFTYPVENAEAQALSLLEQVALTRALEKNSACWAARAKELRTRRFALLPAPSVTYERLTELKEGTALYVEQLSLGNRAPDLPAAGFPPEQVRRRAYSTGRAWALLLDGLAPDWKARATTSLDELLPQGDAAGCEFTSAEREAAAALAQTQVSNLIAARKRARDEFLSQPGWTLVVRFSKPAGLGGFDPMNVERLEGGEVLHRRWIKLSAGGSSIEVLNRPALSRSAGDHPLFSGVRELVIAGLPEDPLAEGAIRANGLTISLKPVSVSREGRTVTVTLPE